VREAVQRLVQEGLAISVPHRGAMVAQLGGEDLQSLYEVREVLEGLAARRATERLDSMAKSALASLVEQHREALEREDLAGHVRLDMRFHLQIRELAGNQPLAEMLDRLQGQVRLAMHSLWGRYAAPQRALEDHEKILAAVLSSDPDAAEKAARAHIARVRTELARHMEQEEES
jgi:DNA-binding GntR family transcriptional regulator